MAAGAKIRGPNRAREMIYFPPAPLAVVLFNLRYPPVPSYNGLRGSPSQISVGDSASHIPFSPGGGQARKSMRTPTQHAWGPDGRKSLKSTRTRSRRKAAAKPAATS